MARSRDPRPANAHAGTHDPQRAGFTLLELLVVVAVLAVVAGGVLLSLQGVEQDAQLQVARAEIMELRRAVLRFRRDTGHLPRRGPFALAWEGGRIDPSVDAHWPAGAPDSPAERAAWFASPANLYQLLEPREGPSFQVALDIVAGPGLTWNPDAARGYQGPYLSRSGEGWVHVGRGLGPDGGGDPAAGTLLDAPVPGIADPWSGGGDGGLLFRWVGAPLAGAPAGQALALGRPYLLFVAPPAFPGAPGPRLLSLGANGRYDSDEGAINPLADGDDLVALLEP